MLRLLVFLSLSVLSCATSRAGETREVVDMAGRHVRIPAQIGRVYGSSPPATLAVYAIAPELLIGLNTPFKTDEKALLRKEVVDLPALGSQAGMGRPLNPEEVLSRKPDLVIAWLDGLEDRAKTEESFAKLGLPVVFLKLDTLADYVPAYRFLGEVLGRKQRGAELADYLDDALTRVAKAVGDIPADKKLRVYYAEGPDGLATDCDKSFHAEPIRLAGADDVYHCEPKSHMGMETIGLEQIIALQPQLILALDPNFARSVASLESWRNVPAAKTGRVVAIPRAPFNWLDRPPSFMRGLGVQWLANLFYPSRYPLDLKAETKKFYRLFLGVDLSDADYARITR
ncbi:ABC transporter substrate-binding protein [Methylocystis bryophila]|uniref:ABC transporter substrate-binding protein n=2 Tax=Methylocystis bryophila TaxID=655015 RepID=A0A1W6N1L6_9HYPH|nr:ABC transporter substrate-binding protein [Methylocystis bryophila]